MKQKLITLQDEIDKSTVIVGDLNIIFPVIYRESTQKICRDTDLDNTSNHVNLINVYRTLLPTAAEYILFFKYTWNIDQNRPDSGPYNKFKRFEIMQNMFFEHNKIKL